MGDDPMMELLLPRERLWRKYEKATPKEERVSRSKFLKFINIASLRMMGAPAPKIRTFLATSAADWHSHMALRVVRRSRCLVTVVVGW